MHLYGRKDVDKRALRGARIAVLEELPVARCEDCGGGADDPRGGLHRGSWHAGAAGGEGDPGEGTDKDADDVDAT